MVTSESQCHADECNAHERSKEEGPDWTHRDWILWEALCLLVALQVWKKVWYLQRLVVEVRSDNLSTLYLLANLKSHSTSLNKIGRELALEFGDCTWKPQFQVHTPGIANSVPDILSRKFQPEKPFALPPMLAFHQEVVPPARTLAFYQTSQAPGEFDS